jgi:hypothetical protein
MARCISATRSRAKEYRDRNGQIRTRSAATGTREERAQVIAKYERHLYDSGLVKDVDELRGRDLVCWCAPEPCHGDVLLRLANN